jgi:hypothetical protein
VKDSSKNIFHCDKAPSEWSGNSDDEGSVDYPLLDEDICLCCGLETKEEEWSKILLCDG